MKTCPILILLSSCILCGVSFSAPPAERPNILWLTAEDISPNLGCYGDSYSITPTLDQFAKEGVRYTQAFGITGVCAPNRSCLITGVYPSRLGSHGMRSVVTLPDSVKCFSEYLRQAGYYCTNNAKTDYNFPVPKNAWDESSAKAHYKNRPAGMPFFAVFNHEVCHESQIRVPEARYQQNTRRLTPEQRHDPAKALVPPYHPDTPEVRRDWARYYDNITAMDYQIADKLAELKASGLAENTIVFFFGDNGAGMPGVKKWVWGDGLHVPMIIHFPKKWQHLSPAKAGETTDRLVSFVDFSATVLSLAGVKAPEHMQGSAFLGTQAGEPRKYVYAIRDRQAERFDTVRVVRDHRYQYMRNFQPHLSWSQFISYTEEMPAMQAWRKAAEAGKLTGPAARYFDARKPVEELYDNDADRHHVRNLASDPAHRAALERMRIACRDWMKKTGDLGLLPEHEMNLRARASTPYQIAADPRLNPLEKLLEAADLANAMERANAAELMKLLVHADPAVRWWGAVGLAWAHGDGGSANPMLMKALEDESADVRIAAAEALGRRVHVRVALPVLIDALEDSAPLVRLYALNVLDRMGKVPMPTIRAISGAKMEAKGPLADYVNRLSGYLPERLGR